MDKVIWKYPLFDTKGNERRINKATCISMPISAEILRVDLQRDLPYVWALVDPYANYETRIFHVIRTGENVGFIPEHNVFLGTLILQGESLVFHIFTPKK